MMGIVPIVMVAAGVGAGAYVQTESLSILAKNKGPGFGALTLPVLILGTAGLGYAIGGDKPGTFGRGVMYGSLVFPALAALYFGGVAWTGRT